MNARQKRLFEEARKKNPDLKMPSETAPSAELSEDDLALIKQGVGDKTSRPGGSQGSGGGSAGDGPREQIGSVVTYFEAKGFGFLRPDDGGRDVFFHVSRLAEGDSTTASGQQHPAAQSLTGVPAKARCVADLSATTRRSVSAGRVNRPPAAACQASATPRLAERSLAALAGTERAIGARSCRAAQQAGRGRPSTGPSRAPRCIRHRGRLGR